MRTPQLQRWWPTTQSMDLVQAPVQQTATALVTEFTRFTSGEPLDSHLVTLANLDEAFALAPYFANAVTVVVALPTQSEWTVLWNNSMLCDGYDSLCWCLTAHHGLTTLHWSAHDDTTTFQPGAQFTHRRWSAGAVVERTVAVSREDHRWSFHQSGTPLPEEDVTQYQARSKRDRLNERALAGFLARLGARPWDEGFYDLPARPAFLLRRLTPPDTILRKPAAAVLQPPR